MRNDWEGKDTERSAAVTSVPRARRVRGREGGGGAWGRVRWGVREMCERARGAAARARV